MNKQIICPVCGVINAVEEMPWHYEGSEFVASQDICSCCGTHYGEDDWAGNEKEVKEMHIMLREKWINSGMKWWGEGFGKSDERKPKNWDPKEQLKNLLSDFK